MERFLQKLDQSWFVNAPPARLAMLRIILGAYTLYYMGRRYGMLMRIAKSDASLFKPVGVVEPLKEPISPALFRQIFIAMMLANVAFLLGWRHRVTGPLFGGLLMWVLCYRNSWSMIYHTDNAIVMHALILGLTPAADALALDAHTRTTPAPERHWQYGWPIQLMNAVTTATYFLSGVAKFAGPLGVNWASGDVLRSQIAIDGLRKDMLGEQASPLAFALYDKVALFKALAVGSMVIELGAPAAMLHRRAGQAWALNAFLLHWGIFFLMRITFRYQLAGLLFASFFEIERLIEWKRGVKG
jgi:hypothetical protein